MGAKNYLSRSILPHPHPVNKIYTRNLWFSICEACSEQSFRGLRENECYTKMNDQGGGEKLIERDCHGVFGFFFFNLWVDRRWRKTCKNPWCDFVSGAFFFLGTVAFFGRLGLGILLVLLVTHLLAERFRIAHVAKRSVPCGSISSGQHGRRDRLIDR